MTRLYQLNDLTKPSSAGQLNQFLREIHGDISQLQSKKVSNDTAVLEKRIKDLEARILRLENP